MLSDGSRDQKGALRADPEFDKGPQHVAQCPRRECLSASDLPPLDRGFDPGLLRTVNSYSELVNGPTLAKPLILQAMKTPYRFSAVNSLQRKRRWREEQVEIFGPKDVPTVNSYCRDTAQNLVILPKRLPARETVPERYWRKGGDSNPR